MGDGVSLPNFEKWGPVSREKMSTIRRLTAENLSRSWSAIPHVTQNDKADITELEKFRKDHAKAAEREGGKLTVTAILVRVVAEGLKRFRQFNASLDPANSEIVYKEYYNIGVAVDTQWGLLVPSIKNADRKGLFDIATELADLSDRARQRKTTLEELQGSCFTITNLGGIGGTSFSPIVNLPEVAILGVSRARVEPVFIDGEFVARTMMPVSLSYDHRVIDGADAARFARWICNALEQPLTMFLE
jgi:pyruvate dehydrogenase E2 component (dihydrolipoamide acetyltransferase)